MRLGGKVILDGALPSLGWPSLVPDLGGVLIRLGLPLGLLVGLPLGVPPDKARSWSQISGLELGFLAGRHGFPPRSYLGLLLGVPLGGLPTR